MRPTMSRISKSLAAMCVVAAIVTPTAAAVDLRSPDAQDAAVNPQTGSYTPAPRVDLRSPDAVDAAVNPQVGSYSPSPASVVDLRSPDAVDASRNPGLVTYTPGPTSSDDSGGTDWGTVSMVSGGGLFIVLLATGLIVFTRRRHDSHKSHIPAISG